MSDQADTLTDSMLVPGTHWRAGSLEIYRCFKRDLWILADAAIDEDDDIALAQWEANWDAAMEHIASLGHRLAREHRLPDVHVYEPDLGIDVELWILIPATEALESAA